MENLRYHPLPLVLLPYLVAVLGFSWLMSAFFGWAFFLTMAWANLLFYPFWQFLTKNWLRGMEKSGQSKEKILHWVEVYGLDCGDLFC